jgi:hypothetical protein
MCPENKFFSVLDVQDVNGNTALHKSLKYPDAIRRVVAATILITEGADRTIKNKVSNLILYI